MSGDNQIVIMGEDDGTPIPWLVDDDGVIQVG